MQKQDEISKKESVAAKKRAKAELIRRQKDTAAQKVASKDRDRIRSEAYTERKSRLQLTSDEVNDLYEAFKETYNTKLKEMVRDKKKQGVGISIVKREIEVILKRLKFLKKHNSLHYSEKIFNEYEEDLKFLNKYFNKQDGENKRYNNYSLIYNNAGDVKTFMNNLLKFNTKDYYETLQHQSGTFARFISLSTDENIKNKKVDLHGEILHHAAENVDMDLLGSGGRKKSINNNNNKRKYEGVGGGFGRSRLSIDKNKNTYWKKTNQSNSNKRRKFGSGGGPTTISIEDWTTPLNDENTKWKIFQEKCLKVSPYDPINFEKFNGKMYTNQHKKDGVDLQSIQSLFFDSEKGALPFSDVLMDAYVELFKSDNYIHTTNSDILMLNTKFVCENDIFHENNNNNNSHHEKKKFICNYTHLTDELKKQNKGIEQIQIILFPMLIQSDNNSSIVKQNNATPNHWILVIVDLVNSRIVIFDTWPKSTVECYYSQFLDCFINEYHQNNPKTQMLNYFPHHSTIKQKNDHECGPLVLYAMYMIGRKIDFMQMLTSIFTTSSSITKEEEKEEEIKIKNNEQQQPEMKKVTHFSKIEIVLTPPPHFNGYVRACLSKAFINLSGFDSSSLFLSDDTSLFPKPLSSNVLETISNNFISITKNFNTQLKKRIIETHQQIVV